MPVDYSKYPDNWKSLSEEVKQDYNYKCGFCGVPDKEVVRKIGPHKYERGAELSEPSTFKIHLATIHLDHNVKNNDKDNLKPACQPCHLDYDKEHHSSSRKYGIDRNNESQLSFF